MPKKPFKKKLSNLDIEKFIAETESDEAYDEWLSEIDGLLGNLSEDEQITDLTEDDFEIKVAIIKSEEDIDNFINSLSDGQAIDEEERIEFSDKLKEVYKIMNISSMTGGVYLN